MKNENQKSVISFIYSYYKTHYIYIFFLILLLCFIGSYYIIDGFFKKSLLDNLVKINNIKEISVVKKKVFIVFIAMIISFSFYCIFGLLIHMIHIKIAPRVRNNITRDCFLRVQSQSFNFFQKNLSGSLSYNIFSLGENIQLLIHKYLPYLLLRFSQIFFSLWAIRFIDPIFLIIFAVWFIVFFIFSFIFMKKFRIASKDYADTSADTSGKITDSVANFFNIKIFASLIFEKKKINEFLNEIKLKFEKKEFTLLLFEVFKSIFNIIAFGFILFFSIKMKIEDKISIGDLVFILGIFTTVSSILWNFSEFMENIFELFGKCNAAMSRIFASINLLDSENAKDIKILNGDIEFKDVSFQFDKASSKIFENFSIKIESGKKIGLVGQSGSGKTTFINLLLRLYDVNSGSILIDGHDIRDFKQDSLRLQIAVIPQDPSLFNRTIFENLEYALLNKENLSDEEKNQLIIDATDKANAHDFIMELPDQYNYLVGERGAKLSGGQRQRIGIARGILKKDVPILILDEVTSALDSFTEEKIQNELFDVMKDKTVLIIAHRLSTLLNFDEILVFKDGEIIERGNHSELIEKNGHYKELWDANKSED